jgi:thioredoxin 1
MSNYKKYGDIINETKTSSQPLSSNDNNKNNNVVHLESQEQLNNLVMNNKVVVVDIYGDFCQPCRAIAPRFSEMSNIYKNDGFVFIKEDCNKKITPGVRGVPTFNFYVNGVLQRNDTIVGADIATVDKTLKKYQDMFKPPQ